MKVLSGLVFVIVSMDIVGAILSINLLLPSSLPGRVIEIGIVNISFRKLVFVFFFEMVTKSTFGLVDLGRCFLSTDDQRR